MQPQKVSTSSLLAKTANVLVLTEIMYIYAHNNKQLHLIQTVKIHFIPTT